MLPPTVSQMPIASPISRIFSPQMNAHVSVVTVRFARLRKCEEENELDFEGSSVILGFIPASETATEGVEEINSGVGNECLQLSEV